MYSGVYGPNPGELGGQTLSHINNTTFKQVQEGHKHKLGRTTLGLAKCLKCQRVWLIRPELISLNRCPG